MQRSVVLIGWIVLMAMGACQTPSIETGKDFPANYIRQHHQDNWDNQVHPILLQYYASLSSLRERDTISLFNLARQIMTALDTLLAHQPSDSLSQTVWGTALQSLHDEYEALPMETDEAAIATQMNMIARQWMFVLGNIGYSKTPVYIFEQKEQYWFALEKKSYNPYRASDREQATATYILAELPPSN